MEIAKYSRTDKRNPLYISLSNAAKTLVTVLSNTNDLIPQTKVKPQKWSRNNISAHEKSLSQVVPQSPLMDYYLNPIKCKKETTSEEAHEGSQNKWFNSGWATLIWHFHYRSVIYPYGTVAHHLLHCARLRDFRENLLPPNPTIENYLYSNAKQLILLDPERIFMQTILTLKPLIFVFQGPSMMWQMGWKM